MDGWFDGWIEERGSVGKCVSVSERVRESPIQVVNLEDCISINHNWVNACNIHHAVEQVGARLHAVTIL